MQGGGGGGSDILSLLGPLSGSLSGVSIHCIFLFNIKFKFVKTNLLKIVCKTYRVAVKGVDLIFSVYLGPSQEASAG
jgi:hypothetical protein